MGGRAKPVYRMPLAPRGVQTQESRLKTVDSMLVSSTVLIVNSRLASSSNISGQFLEYFISSASSPPSTCK